MGVPTSVLATDRECGCKEVNNIFANLEKSLLQTQLRSCNIAAYVFIFHDVKSNIYSSIGPFQTRKSCVMRG